VCFDCKITTFVVKRCQPHRELAAAPFISDDSGDGPPPIPSFPGGDDDGDDCKQGLTTQARPHIFYPVFFQID
jgi:hypothetical protein